LVPLATLVVTAVGVWAPTPAPAVAGCQAADIVVTNTLDGPGPPPQSLRAAFAAATASAGPQTICVQSGLAGPINLTTAGGGELVYNAATTPALTVEGNGITVRAAPNARVIDNQTAGPLHLADLTITGGNATSSCQADGAAGITTDQRGVARPQGRGCDIGAVEVQPPSPPSPILVVPRFTG
jgi:hypothetical protein